MESKFSNSSILEIMELAKQGDVEAQKMCDLLKTDMDLVKEFADKGDDTAQVLLASYITDNYDMGSEEFMVGMNYFQMAAQQNNEVAEYHMGWYFENTCDYKNAFYWYERSAMHGYPTAMNNLGCCYQNGWGTNVDKSKAMYWFKQAYKNGESLGRSNIIRSYIPMVVPIIVIIILLLMFVL